MRQRAVSLAVLSAGLVAVALSAAIGSGVRVSAGGPATILVAPGVHGQVRRFYASARRLQLHRARAHAHVTLRVRIAPARHAAAPKVAPRTLEPSRIAAPTRSLAHELVFQWPAEGTITTPFLQGSAGNHDGIHIGSLRSLAVTAAAGGRVIHVGYTTGFEGYGNIVDVEVAPGVEALYAHLSAMAVHLGEEVSAGDPIGTAGCTGICTGTHLHFEVRVNGTPVDPRRYLP